MQTVPPFPPIHLSDGAGNWLRCGFETRGIPCGVHAAAVCANCGPRCLHHQQTTICFHPSKSHQPVGIAIDETRHPVTAILAALNSRRITPENGIQRLRAYGAAEYLIDTVQVIESGITCTKGDYSEFLLEVGMAA